MLYYYTIILWSYIKKRLKLERSGQELNEGEQTVA